MGGGLPLDKALSFSPKLLSRLGALLVRPLAVLSNHAPRIDLSEDELYRPLSRII